MFKKTLCSICVVVLLCVTLSAEAQLLRSIFNGGGDNGNNANAPAPQQEAVPVIDDVPPLIIDEEDVAPVAIDEENEVYEGPLSWTALCTSVYQSS